MLATAARAATTAAALHAAVVGVDIGRGSYNGNELTMTATITESAALDACSLLRNSLNKFVFVGSDGDGDETWYVQAYDRVTERTFWLNMATDLTATGCSVVMYVHNYAGLDYTRELDEPTLDDRLDFASIVRRLFA